MNTNTLTPAREAEIPREMHLLTDAINILHKTLDDLAARVNCVMPAPEPAGPIPNEKTTNCHTDLGGELETLRERIYTITQGASDMVSKIEL